MLRRTRGRKDRRLLHLLFCLGFLLLWSLLTFCILYAQDLIFGPLPLKTSPTFDSSYIIKQVPVLVGHYNGNLPKEKINFTDEELNRNDYVPIEGWGEEGKGVTLSTEDEIRALHTFPINHFNLFVSDRISVSRSLPDVRRSECRHKTYPADLPTSSIVIVFHNEAFSTLLRSVHSILLRTPRSLLREIILVDDFSSRAFLKAPLEEAVSRLSSKVPIKIVRSRERIGLIRARMIGASVASGDVLTFLDSHVECTQGWLEPLVDRIRIDRRNVVCPIIDVINDNSFAFQKGLEIYRGGFNWNLQFRWYSMPSAMAKERAADRTSPIESPTMAGGLFAIHREYYHDIGEYDAHMDIWGGENIEMSFRIWQCGGRIEIHPCSHVGHIFRKSSPHDFPGKSSGAILNANLMRVAEVWMDDYRWLFYKTSPGAYNVRERQDVSERVELRKKLRCESFDWYLTNVFPDHFLPTPDSVFGRISSSSLCLVSRPSTESGLKRHRITVSPCTLGFDLWQLWVLRVDGRIRSDEHQCLLGVKSGLDGNEVTVEMRECGGYDNERWNYYRRTRQLVHVDSGLCLSLSPDEKGGDNSPPLLQACTSSTAQKWRISEVNWRTPPSSASTTTSHFFPAPTNATLVT